MTPDGFLLCEAVPIARTGEQIYAVGELPLAVLPGADGLIKVIRLDVEVFRPETIASFEGKPVTLDHPAEGVNPDNAKKLTVGHAQHVRRGEGADTDLLIADLLITDATAIEAIRITADPVTNVPVVPLREVSCGYDAEYVQDVPGIAYQKNIVGNHVALVERGRAGARCSIQDKESIAMKANALLQKLLAAFRTNDSAAITEAVADAEKELETPEQKAEREAKETTDAAAAADAAKAADAKRLDTLETTVADMKKALDLFMKRDEPSDEEKKAADAAAEAAKATDAAKVADAMRDVATRAEMLAPGYSMPTADSVATLDAVANVQRAVLAHTIKTDDGKKLVAPFLGGKTLDEMSVDALGVAFVAASELARAKNNGARSAAVQSFGKGSTVAEINEANRKFYQS